MRTAFRLLVWLRPFAGEVLLSMLLGAGTIAAGIGLLGTSAYLIAAAALRPSIADLQVAIVGVRFFGLSRGVLRYLERLVSHSVNFRLLAEVRVWFYRAVEPLAPGGVEDLRGGDLLARAASDIEALENFYVRAVAPPVTALVITIGACLFVGRFAPILGWTLAVGLCIAGVLVPALTHRLASGFGRRAASARAALSAEFVDTLHGMADRLVSSAQEEACARVLSADREYERVQMAAVRAGALGSALSGLTAHLALVMILAAGLPLVERTRLDWVSLAVLALVTLASFEAVQPLSQAAQQLESALEAGRRLFSLADRKAAVQVPAQPLGEPAGRLLNAKGLWMRYPGADEDCLKDIDLQLSVDRRIAVVGPSGAGKSSLAGVLARLYDYQAGSLELDGREIRGYDPSAVRRVIAFSIQPVFLFSGSLRSNLVMDRANLDEDQLAAAARTAGLDEVVRRLPGGFDGWVGSQGEQLSGGERQRVALARALLSPAKILVLDEPTAGLDAPSAAAMMVELERSTRGRGLCLITHRLANLEWMDEIIVLSAGRVVERGSHSSLMAAGGWYQRAVRFQNRFLEDGEL